MAKNVFRVTIIFCPFLHQNDLKQKTTGFILLRVNLLLSPNLGFLAFIPSASREDRRISGVVHLLMVTGAGCLHVNKRLRRCKKGEEEKQFWDAPSKKDLKERLISVYSLKC